MAVGGPIPSRAGGQGDMSSQDKLPQITFASQGPLWSLLGGPLGCLGSPSGRHAARGHLRLSLARLGRLGSLFGASQGLLGPSGAAVEPSGAVMGPPGAPRYQHRPAGPRLWRISFLL